MNAALTVLGAIAAFFVAVPLLIFVTEMLAGLRGLSSEVPRGPLPATVVLMPAHDEAAGIGAAIAALSGARVQGVELLVVADNCRDDTAAIARAAGCRVAERCDPTRRGKGYALAFGRDALAADPPACVIILDADCTVEGGGIQLLARTCVASGAAVQSSYLFRSVPTGTGAVSNFAFLVKNLVRQQGMARLGGVAALTGTGMAIPWADFAAAPLASDDLVEDLALGIWLTRRARPPRFAAAATTWSDAVAGADLMAQRRRWEHGFVATARRRALPLLAEGVWRRSRGMAWLGLHLLVPPLALLVAAGAAALLLTVALAVLGGSWLVPALLALLLGLAGGAVVAAWARYGREQIGARALLGIPAYVIGKLPMYRSLAGKGPAEWQRTRRAGEDRRPS